MCEGGRFSLRSCQSEKKNIARGHRACGELSNSFEKAVGSFVVFGGTRRCARKIPDLFFANRKVRVQIHIHTHAREVTASDFGKKTGNFGFFLV